MSQAGLYLHIPFCDKRCDYCDFVTFSDRSDLTDSYLSAMELEMKQYEGAKISTLFIGGGTPTAITAQQISRLMSSIHQRFDTSQLQEATVEANPESALEDRLTAYLNGGINRLSFGLQSTQNEILSRLGRLHDYDGFLQAYRRAQAIGFKNLNVDLMFGLPGHTMDQFLSTLNEVVSLHPNHISAYALKVENGTPFYAQNVKVDPDLQADMYLAASSFLEKAGYSHYEISNFAQPGYESQHNLRYWKNEEVIGIGISAAGYLGGKRIKNTSKIHGYIQTLQSGTSPDREESQLSTVDADRENLMLGLRLKTGVDMNLLRKSQVPNVDHFLSQGWAIESQGRFSLKPQGWLISNQIFQHLVG